MNSWKKLLFDRIVGVGAYSKPRDVRSENIKPKDIELRDVGSVEPGVGCLIAGFL